MMNYNVQKILDAKAKLVSMGEEPTVIRVRDLTGLSYNTVRKGWDRALLPEEQVSEKRKPKSQRETASLREISRAAEEAEFVTYDLPSPDSAWVDSLRPHSEIPEGCIGVATRRTKEERIRNLGQLRGIWECLSGEISDPWERLETFLDGVEAEPTLLLMSIDGEIRQRVLERHLGKGRQLQEPFATEMGHRELLSHCRVINILGRNSRQEYTKEEVRELKREFDRVSRDLKRRTGWTLLYCVHW